MATNALARRTSLPFLFEDFLRPWFDDNGILNRVDTMPAVNVTEKDKFYVVSLAAPGLKKDNFKIKLDGNMLTISAEKEEKKEEKEEKYTMKEYNYSSFSRSFTLPNDVRQDGIDAHYENGVLNIQLPRKEDAKKLSATKQIAVK